MIQQLGLGAVLSITALILFISCGGNNKGWVRINHPGYRLNFTEVNGEGVYKIEAGKIVSPYSRTQIRLKK